MSCIQYTVPIPFKWKQFHQDNDLLFLVIHVAVSLKCSEITLKCYKITGIVDWNIFFLSEAAAELLVMFKGYNFQLYKIILLCYHLENTPLGYK